MKPQRRLVSAVLLVSMPLSLLGGGYTSAAAAQAVTTDSELAPDPLTQDGSIAYEQHEDGHAVSLDRTADRVTMNITSVPGAANSRSAEKARLYLRTGMNLKPKQTHTFPYIQGRIGGYLLSGPPGCASGPSVRRYGQAGFSCSRRTTALPLHPYGNSRDKRLCFE